MKSIEIVVHCFAGKLPLYAQHLRFQLASLIRHPPQAEVVYTLFWAGPEYDPHVAAVLENLLSCPFTFNPVVMPREQLFRRAIGRHQRSQETKCDVLWQCDADYYMGEGCIDSVCAQVQDDGRLWFPRRTLINVDHEAGETTLLGGQNVLWPTIPTHLFKPTRNHFAIGGLQLLGRETAKRVGYLGNKSKWQRPVDPAKGFACFRDDTAWRRMEFAMANGQDKQVKFDAVNLYRLRHEFSSLRPNGFTPAAPEAQGADSCAS